MFFYDSILKNKAPIVDIDDGVLAVKLISKILESLEIEAPILV